MPDLPTPLKTLAGAYFHQDFDLEAPTPDAVVENYARESSREAREGLVTEIAALLATDPSEHELEHLWNDRYYSAFDPVDRLGMTYRDWFLHVIELVNASPS